MDVSEVIVGNVCSLCAMVSDSVSGTRKKNSQMLGIQIISQFFYGAGSVILKGYSSTAQNVVAVFRNLAAMKEIKSKALEWLLVALGVVLGVIFNNRGLLGWLPIAANLEYSVAMFRLRNNRRGLKIAFIVNMVMYAAFNFIIMNYVGGVSTLVVAATTLISLLKGPGEEPEESPGT